MVICVRKDRRAAGWRPLSFVSPNQILVRPVRGSEWISSSATISCRNRGGGYADVLASLQGDRRRR